MGRCYTSTSGYNAQTAIGKFYDRDAMNEVGFEMRMTSAEYFALSRFIEKLFHDGIERGRQELANAVRSALPTESNP